MTRLPGSLLLALASVAAVAALTHALLPVLGLASAALLFLLPVLFAATRGGLWPGLFAALAGTAAYNYLLVEPRYTFRVDRLDGLVSVCVLGAVAVVTSRLATRLLAREAEANARAGASAELARLSAVLAAGDANEALDKGVDFIAARYGPARLIDAVAAANGDAAFTSLDLAAAAWALHNGDMTGHGTEIMGAADWSFVPVVAKTRTDLAVLALARPAEGGMRALAELDQVQQLAWLLGQCRDRANLDRERGERVLLEQSERLRRTFLASLAHDFRTPLTVITGRLELIAQRGAGEGDPAVDDALAAARRLDRTMADLLGAARLEDGSLHPANESCDLVDAVASACAGVMIPVGLTLTRRVPADLPFVHADPVLLQHVLANLIDNGLRHARQALTIAAAPANGRIMLTVDDDGPGVPAPERERIFARFQRLAGTDHSQGSGLGLAIVKGFAEAMGGSVSVGESPLGGARFALSLPHSAGAGG
ncbi:ATP-binding protein [Novosphingobium sp.]|uniref:sensor histidine kinase n=1 Tax=Novosphingobium sp. TaxID=1874826 RepID=UPI00260D2013|nr:ATP-binding protein [Novosphingobium sp.]